MMPLAGASARRRGVRKEMGMDFPDRRLTRPLYQGREKPATLKGNS
jgi:hypothetical protein